MILFAGNDLNKLDRRQNTEVGMGKLGDHAIHCELAKKKFASAIKLRPADRCVAMEPGIQEHEMCSAKALGRGISLKMSRINY
jgi:hypothetical protein